LNVHFDKLFNLRY